MKENQEQVYYSNYLELEKLLSSQSPISKKYGEEAHDETLFIIVHQVYELWFKQILHELNMVQQSFAKESILESSLANSILKLERVVKIQELLINQIAILETMTPMDFLEFRDLLIPASGFQSVQFRKIEILLGLKSSQRPDTKTYNFLGRLNKQDQEDIKDLSSKPSLFNLIEKWLERLPFLESNKFKFWAEYQKSVQEMLSKDERIIQTNKTLSAEEKEMQLKNLEMTKKTFESLLNEKEHESLIQQGRRRLSQKAIQSALFILLYRDEPLFIQPFRLLNTIMDLDENITSWRNRHAQLAQRMLGSKIGTGGTSGHQYLKATSERNKIFADFANMSTFLIPKSALPKLPEELKKELNSHFSNS